MLRHQMCLVLRLSAVLLLCASLAPTPAPLLATTNPPTIAQPPLDQARLVQDVIPGEQGSQPADLVTVGGRTYFTGYAGGDACALWYSTRSDQISQPIGVISRCLSSTSPPPFRQSYILLPAASRLFFAYVQDNTLVIRSDDGAATTEVQTFAPAEDPVQRVGRLQGSATLGDTLFFTIGDLSRDTSDNLVGDNSLWRSRDGGAGADELFRPPLGSNGVRRIDHLTTMGGWLFFTSADGGLWRTDGTPGGTSLVKQAPLAANGVGSIGELTPMGDWLFFTSADGGLWRTDGTPGGTGLVKQVPAYWLKAVGGKLFFWGNGGLWVSDGSADGTRPLGLRMPLFVTTSTAAGGLLYMTLVTGNPNDGFATTLWRSDGTPEGTFPLVKLAQGIPQAASLNGRVVLASPAANDETTTLVGSDGSISGTVTLGRVLLDGKISLLGDKLLFATRATKDSSRLWVSDGTLEGTGVVQTLPRVTSNIALIGDGLLFGGDDGIVGAEPWALQGAPGAEMRMAVPSLAGGPPSGGALLPVSYRNFGLAASGPLTLTLTLGAGLRYLRDSSGVAPDQIGERSITWHLSDTTFLAGRSFTVRVGLPDAAYGTRATATLVLTSAAPGGTPTTREAQTTLMVAHQIYLPFVANR